MSGRIARIALLSFFTGFSGAMMPGPLLVAVMEQTAVQGLQAVVGLLAGHAILELFLVFLLISGLRAILESPGVRGAIGVVGGLALVWMGVDMARHAAGLSLDTNVTGAAAYSWPKLLLVGAAICAINPYFTGWWATIGMGQLAHMAPRTPGEYVGFYIGHEGADFAWYAIVGAIVVTGSRWLTDSIYQRLILGCGIVLVCLGLWFFLAGWRLWLAKPRPRAVAAA